MAENTAEPNTTRLRHIYRNVVSHLVPGAKVGAAIGMVIGAAVLVGFAGGPMTIMAGTMVATKAAITLAGVGKLLTIALTGAVAGGIAGIPGGVASGGAWGALKGIFTKPYLHPGKNTDEADKAAAPAKEKETGSPAYQPSLEQPLAASVTVMNEPNPAQPMRWQDKFPAPVPLQARPPQPRSEGWGQRMRDGEAAQPIAAGRGVA